MLTINVPNKVAEKKFIPTVLKGFILFFHKKMTILEAGIITSVLVTTVQEGSISLNKCCPLK